MSLPVLFALLFIIAIIAPLFIAPTKVLAFLPYRCFLVLVLMAIFLISCFGFLATFEYGLTGALGFKVAYGLGAALSAAGAAILTVATIKKFGR